jgi:NADPH2:quinone reductase
MTPIGQRVRVASLSNSVEEALSGSALGLEDQPYPEVLRPDEVVVAIESAAVGWVDLLMTSGQYQHLVQPPYTPGLEYSGRVARVGSAVTHLAEGDPVMVDGLLAGPRSKGDYQGWGGFATWALAPASALLPKPERLSFDQAASFLSSYETAYFGLFTRGRLTAGETVVIHGASGATGLAAVHLAKLAGATVIATGRSLHKLEPLRDEGADHLIPLADNDAPDGIRPFRDDIKALTGGRGADLVYDGVGGAIGRESLRCLRFGGRYLIIGWASTPDVARGKGGRGAPNANQLPTNLIMMKRLDVLGCPVALSTFEDPSLGPPRRAQLLAWVEEGRLNPRVSHRFPLTDFRAALAAKWRGEVLGACVLHPRS